MLQQTSTNQLEQVILTELRAEAYEKAQMYAESDAYYEAFNRLADGMNGDQARALREFIMNGEHATSLAAETMDGLRPPDHFVGYRVIDDGRVYAEYVTHKQRFAYLTTYAWDWVEEDRMRVLIDWLGDAVTF